MESEKSAGFKNKLSTTHQSGKFFLVDKSLVFYSEKYEREFVCPAGVITDFASIPWFAQSFCQVLGNNIRSAVLHDFHCRKEGKEANQVTQKIADDLFREGLAVDNVRTSKVRVMFAFVTGYQRLKYLFKSGEKYDG